VKAAGFEPHQETMLAMLATWTSMVSRSGFG
jgi:hypothetical protein